MVGVWGNGASDREMNPFCSSNAARSFVTWSNRLWRSSRRRWSSLRNSALTTSRKEVANPCTVRDATWGSRSYTVRVIELESTSESTSTFLARSFSSPVRPSSLAAALSTLPRVTLSASCSTLVMLPVRRFATMTCSAWYWVTSRLAPTWVDAMPASRPRRVVTRRIGHRRRRMDCSLVMTSLSVPRPQRARVLQRYRRPPQIGRAPSVGRDGEGRGTRARWAGPAPAGGPGCRSSR